MIAASRVALQLCYPRSMTATAFDNLDDYLPLPRVSGMAVSADAPRVVTTVAELNDKSTEYITAVWEADPTGRSPARRLIRGANGESSPAFTVDGDLLFVSSRRTSDKPTMRTHPLRCGGYPSGSEAVEMYEVVDAFWPITCSGRPANCPKSSE